MISDLTPYLQFKNEPSEETPLDEANLNDLQKSILKDMNRKVSCDTIITDANNAIFSGYYQISGTCRNLPVSVNQINPAEDSVYLLVIARADVVQYTSDGRPYYPTCAVTQFFINGLTNKVYIRQGIRETNPIPDPVDYSFVKDTYWGTGNWELLNEDKPNVALGTISLANWKWEGKNVYIKKLDCGKAPNNSTKSIATGLNFSNGRHTLVKLEGIAYRDDASYIAGRGVTYPLPHVDTTNNTIAVFLEGAQNSISIRTASDRSAYSCYVTLYYIDNSEN